MNSKHQKIDRSLFETITDGVTPANNQSFSYDTMQRLSQATGGYGTYGFTYDKDGNRLTQTLGGVTTNYTYETKNDLDLPPISAR